MQAGNVAPFLSKVLIAESVDSASPPVTVKGIFIASSRMQQPIGELEGDAPDGGALPREVLNGGRAMVTVMPGASSSPLAAAVSLRATLAADGLSKTGGELTFDSAARVLSIPANTIPSGQTLSAVLLGAGGEADDEARLRPDRPFTVYVRPIRAISAAMKTATDGEILGAITIQHRGNARVFVASVSASGGVGDYIPITGFRLPGKLWRWMLTARFIFPRHCRRCLCPGGK